MRKLQGAMLIFALVLCIFVSSYGIVSADSVTGAITSDTTWTYNRSPYKLSSPVTVANGATLTIEPGVTIDLNNYYIQVDGNLIAQVTTKQNVIFTSSQTGQYVYFHNSGNMSVIDNAVFEKVCINIEGCSPKINNNTFTLSIDVSITAQSGASEISNNIFRDLNNYHAISASGSQTITNNKIYGSGWQFGIQASGNTYVSNNYVTGCWSAIHASGNAVIDGNVLVNSRDTGVYAVESTAGMVASAVTIKNNYIAYNPNYGIVGGGLIGSNTIYNNSVGIQNPSPSAVISNNNIVNNTKNSIVLLGPNNVDAKNNWWGTIDTKIISQTIHDSKAYSGLGTVNYQPILPKPSSSAPTNDALNFSNANQGGLPFYIDYGTLSGIQTVAYCVTVGLILAWVFVAIILVVRRFRK